MGKINMPEKQFIHADEDVESVLRFADSIGLLLLPDMLEDKNARPRKPEELRAFSRGTIYLFRPEWVMDDIQMRLIDGGAYAGKYTVPPSTNFSPINLYFHGEMDIEGVHRLGIGGISFKRDWFHYKAHEIRLSPPEVEPMYKQVCKHLFSKIFVKGGVHRYYVCKQAAELAARIETLPPFDYIPWPPPNLNKTSRR